MGFMDDLANRAAQGFAPGWNPKTGDSIGGLVEDVDRVTGTKYGDYDVITVRRIINDRVTDERVAIHAFHTSLAGSMQRKWPHPGGVVFIKYEGEKHNDRTDQDFHAYQYVYVAPDQVPPSMRLGGASAPSNGEQQGHASPPAPAPASAPAAAPSSEPFF